MLENMITIIILMHLNYCKKLLDVDLPLIEFLAVSKYLER